MLICVKVCMVAAKAVVANGCYDFVGGMFLNSLLSSLMWLG